MPFVPSLWPSTSNAVAYDWNALFEQWAARSVVPAPVKTVQVNLKAATDPQNRHNPSISQFLNFLNFPAEQEGVYWLLHEIVSSRWMFGEIRVDYVREIAKAIDIDIHFPRFPGTPDSSLTVREFLESNLSNKEFSSLQLDAAVPDAYAVEDNFEDEEDEDDEEEEAEVKVNYPTTHILVIRNKDTKAMDDDITILKTGRDSYIYRYKDTNAKMGSGETHMTCQKVNISAAEVIASLRYTLNFLVIDTMPFESIQVMIPGLPSIMLNTADVTAMNRDVIYDAMEMTMRNWPVRM
jgi:hypothetical protein